MVSVRTNSPPIPTSSVSGSTAVATPKSSERSSPTTSAAHSDPSILIPKQMTLNGRPVQVGSFKISKGMDKALLATLLRPQGTVQEVDAPESSEVISGADDKWYRYCCTLESSEKNGRAAPDKVLEVHVQINANNLKHLTARNFSSREKNSSNETPLTQDFQTIEKTRLSTMSGQLSGKRLIELATDLKVQDTELGKKIQNLSARIAQRTQLSTTGYQFAMSRLNQASQPDNKCILTLARAKEYESTAKKTYPIATLKSLAELQTGHIYRTSDGRLLTGTEMTPEQLTECLEKCRQHGFANCDMQALEVGLHIHYRLGIKNFTLFSNDKMSHNYVVISKCKDFPKGAIIDAWTGKFVQEMSTGNKVSLWHWDANLKINSNMHKWIETYGKDYVLD